MKGSEIILKVLEKNNVDTVFGYPGGTILNVYDALYYNSKIKHYLTAHEQGAIHAADGYARSTGKVGVCFATSGPGATNLVTGIATAFMDSIPLVVITCNVGRNLLGKDSFQEVDISGITMPITKHNFIIDKVEDLERTINKAFAIAKNGRPGPVLIDILKNITAEEYEYKDIEYLYEIKIREDISQLDKAISIIEKSSKIMIISGGGVVYSNAREEIMMLSRKLNAPIGVTLMGIAGVDNYFDNFIGMIGMHGTVTSNTAITKTDCIIAVGTRFSDRVATNLKNFEKPKIIHIDIDPAEINKNINITTALVGDAKKILKILLEKINKKESREFLDKILASKKEVIDCTTRLTPYYIMNGLEKVSKSENIIITTEVGQNQMWAARFFRYKDKRSLITSGGLGTMGFGTGASIGSAIGNPDKQVVAIAGDGSFRMNCNELATISFYKIPIIIVIMNNGTLGMVRQWQRLFYEKRYSETTLDRAPDFVKLADAYDIKGYRVGTKEEYDNVIKEVYGKGFPCIIDAKIDIDESIYPMIAPGGTLNEMITE